MSKPQLKPILNTSLPAQFSANPHRVAASPDIPKATTT